MASTGIKWVRPPAELARAVKDYGGKVRRAVEATAQRSATIMEGQAKSGAPWTDRTGNARSGIFGTAESGGGRTSIYLSHGAGVYYGVYLELKNGGRYAVIMRTIEGHLPELKSMLDAILR